MSNVFEFLGLPADHRTGNKITQHVKNIDEVPESKKGFPVWAQIKKDGVYALVIKTDSKVRIFSRTGKAYTNIGKLAESFRKSNAIDGVYIAELCCDMCSLEALSGIVNPNRNKKLSHEQQTCKEVMYLAFHDYLTLDEFIIGESSRTYKSRFNYMYTILPFIFNTIQSYTIYNQVDEDNLFNEVARIGEEGLVFKNPDEGWVGGHKGYRQYKRVRGVSYDLKCIGVEEGEGKMKGKVGNLIFKWKGDKEIKCPLGKGWTHEDARGVFQTYKHIKAGLHDTSINGSPVGQIFEVYALQESSKGKLRLPKVGELRHDKVRADVGE